MPENKQFSPYFRTIGVIEGIKFTPREVDILACILSGKSVGVIAALLRISDRTLEAHLSNIRSKLNCNSRSDIINFLEKSETLPILRNHYQSLLINNTFIKSIEKISKQLKKKVSLKIVYNKTDQKLTSFIANIKDYLQLVGIEAALELRSKDNFSLSVHHKDVENIDYVLYILDQNSLDHIKTNENFKKIFQPINSQKYIPVILTLWSVTPDHTEIKGIECIHLNPNDNFYQSFLTLLQKILPDINLKEINFEFSKLYKITLRDMESTPQDIEVKAKNMDKVGYLPTFFRNHKTKIIAASLLFFSVISIWIRTTEDPAPGSQLVIPANLLERPNLIARIDQKLNQQKDIQTVALVGMGGVGKTTIARQFAKLQNSSFVWEINAENKESIISAFNDLAFIFATTSKTRDELSFIQGIKQPDIKATQILNFVQKRLKSHSGWILIYDNLEDFSMKNYFPFDPKIWGKGKLILITRNMNIQNNSFMKNKNLIHIPALNTKESVTLFSSILYDLECSNLPRENQDKVMGFLKEIPPFPLDIISAAYYIKATKSTYRQYLEHMKKSSDQFEQIQTKLLTEITKTRYGIVTMSLEKLFHLHQDFKELFLIICLLDSENIPRELLVQHKDYTTVYKFIDYLLQNGFITHESDINNSFPSFSLHRITQEIGLTFILNSLTDKEKILVLEQIISSIKIFYKRLTDKKYSTPIMLIPHLDALLKTLPKINLPQDIQSKWEMDLLYMIAYAHYKGADNFVTAKKYFIKILEKNLAYNNLSQSILANILKDLGDICFTLFLFEEGLKYSHQSIKLATNLPENTVLIAENLKNIGKIYLSLNNFDQAKYYLETALIKISKNDSISKKELEADIYAQLGWLYSSIYITGKNGEVAKNYAYKSLEIINGNKTFYNANPKTYKNLSCLIAINKVDLGRNCSRAGHYKEAMDKGFKDAKFIIENSLDSCQPLVKVQLSLGIGEVLLREGKLKKAKVILSESMKNADKLVGESYALVYKVFRAEALIRLGNLKEAYKDCESIFTTKSNFNSNYWQLLYLHTLYNAALIKYQQNDFNKSIEHFTDFFKGMQKFCKGFLDEKVYQELEDKGIFTIPIHDPKHTKDDIKKHFKNSVEIFTAIYGSSHPFVKDYILQNYNEAIKPWWKFW